MRELAEAISERYTIEREIGAGGMATVYLAHDVRHHRKVAIKVLRPELAAVIGSERFLHEIATMAGLQHPHILPLFDSGDIDGQLFFVMPFVEGETLRDRLERSPPLTVDEAVALASEVADALDYAHRHGIIHRDIKPENVLLHDGRALVADFGIALTTGRDARLTTVGISVGTPAYMSPEQALGERALDARSDIYSVGVLLYEMLTGTPPFTGASAQAIVGKVVTEKPVAPSRRRKGIPHSVDQAVLTAIAKDPADRFDTASGFRAAFQGGHHATRRRWPFVAGTLALIAVVALVTWRLGAPASKPLAGKSSIAVLPFTNRTGDTSKVYLSEGISEDLLDDLSNIHALDVREKATSFRFTEANPDLAAIARSLNDVDAIVTGRVDQTGDTLIVFAQLHDIRSNRQIWSASFTHAATRDLRALDAAIVDSIIRTLGITSVAHIVRGTRDSLAHDLVLRAKHLAGSRNIPDLDHAVSLFRAATLRDSTYADAFAGLASVSGVRGIFSASRPADYFPQAAAAVRRALFLDPSSADAHATQGFIDVFYNRDWSDAGREYARAIAIDSTQSQTWLFRTWYYTAIGQTDSAVRSVTRAQALDPASMVIGQRLGTMRYMAGDMKGAESAFEAVVAAHPDATEPRDELATVYADDHRCAEALRLVDLPRVGGNPGMESFRQYAEARCGRVDPIRRYADRLDSLAHAGVYQDGFWLAVVYAALHDKARMMASLHRAVDDHAWGIFFLPAHPAFREYQSDPEYLALLHRANLR